MLKGAPTNVRAWISAEARYRMWVNGVLASRGPADIGRDYDSGAPGPWFDDVRDLTPLFHAGENVIAVEVFAKPLVQSESAWGNPGFKFDAQITSGKQAPIVIASDDSWRCAVAQDLLSPNRDFAFRWDMEKEPVGWMGARFNDHSWKEATLCRNQRATIVSEIPALMEAVWPAVDFVRMEGALRSKTLRMGSSSRATVRFGRVLAGYIGLKVKSRGAGAKLLIQPNERDAPGHHRQFEVVLREGEQVIETPIFDSFSVVNLQIMGTSSKYEVEIEDVRVVATSYPVQYRGSFASSDKELDRLWEVSRWVTQICMQTHHLDSPHHQEPISDPGDYLIEALVNDYAFMEPSLVRQDLRKYARILVQRNYGAFHTSYALLWLQTLMNYQRHTGDDALVRELAPVVHGLVDHFRTFIGANGLLSEAPNYMFMDWVEIAGFGCHHPPAVIGQGYMTALYYRALADDSAVASLLHETDRLATNEETRATLQNAFDFELWDDSKGLYRDGKPHQNHQPTGQWLPPDRDIETFSTQVNTLAVTCGLATGDRAKRIMRGVLARADMNCQPYFMHFVFEALVRAGDYEEFAVTQLKRWKVQPDTQSFLEMWNTGDLSHAWIATPLIQLSAHILGVDFDANKKTVSVAPHSCGLAQAHGKVPTPFGDVTVGWKSGVLDIVLPKDASGRAFIGGTERKLSPGSNRFANFK